MEILRGQEGGWSRYVGGDKKLGGCVVVFDLLGGCVYFCLACEILGKGKVDGGG